MDCDLVSVVIPCYNDGCYLAHAVQSVLSQTYCHVEIVIVDDGSTDNTGFVANQLTAQEHRVRLVQTLHRGLPSARNRGMQECNGEYLQFLDADDALEPNKIALQVEFLKANPDVGIVYSDVRCFTTDDPHSLRLALRDSAQSDGCAVGPSAPSCSGEAAQ